MQCKYAFFCPTLSSTKKLLEVERKDEAKECLGKELYTSSDLRESFEEQSCFDLNSFKKPKLFSRKSGVILILHID
jgi:hypothetical protein